MKEFNLPEGWKFVSLYDLVDVIGGVSYAPDDITSSGIRVIRGGNIQGNLVELRDDDVFLPDTYKNCDNSLRKGDIVLVASTGSVEALGRTATVWENMNNVQIGAFLRILRPKQPKYAALISAWLSCEHYFRYIRLVAKGTSINNISLSHIKGFKIPIPSDEKAASFTILYNAVAKKININRAINRNLEALAKQLYDYWFVQFDFPNEEGKPYKSSGGAMVWNEKLKRDIPASWETVVVDDVAEVFNGATPSTGDEQNYGGDVVWITPKDLSDQKQKFVYQGERNISQAGYDSCSTHLLPINTVLMSSRAPIGLLAIAKAELCTNQGFKSFVPKEDRIATYLYYYLQFHIKQIEQLGTGTTFKEVSREDVLKFPILKPSDVVLDLWEERVSALNDKQLELQKENENLVKQRDELLPLLMNGQVSLLNCD